MFFGSWLCAMPCVISHLKSKRSWHWNLLKNSGCMATSICTDSAQILRWGKDWVVHLVDGCHLLASFHLWNWPLNSGIAVSWFTSCRTCHNILMISSSDNLDVLCIAVISFPGRATPSFGMLHGAGREAVCSLLDRLWWAWAVSLLESSVNTGKGLSQAVYVVMPALPHTGISKPLSHGRA